MTKLKPYLVCKECRHEEGQRIVVRKYGDSEWHSPTENYCFEE